MLTQRGKRVVRSLAEEIELAVMLVPMFPIAQAAAQKKAAARPGKYAGGGEPRRRRSLECEKLHTSLGTLPLGNDVERLPQDLAVVDNLGHVGRDGTFLEKRGMSALGR